MCGWAREGRDLGFFFWFFCLVSPGQGGDSSCTTWTPEFAPPPYGPGPGHLKAFKTPQGGDSPQPSTRRLALCSRDCFLLDPPPPARPPPQASQRDSASWVVVAPSTVAMTGDVETDRCALGPLALAWSSCCWQRRAGVWGLLLFFFC